MDPVPQLSAPMCKEMLWDSSCMQSNLTKRKRSEKASTCSFDHLTQATKVLASQSLTLICIRAIG